MASLPIYHPVPTDEKSALPLYQDEVEEPFDPRSVHPASIGLSNDYPHDSRMIHPASIRSPLNHYHNDHFHNDGRQFTLLETAKERVRTLSKIKKAFLALAIVYFTWVITSNIGRSFGGHHRHHNSVTSWREHAFNHGPKGVFTPCNGNGPDTKHAEDFAIIPTVYGTSISLSEDQRTANASFSVPLHRGKSFNINFEGLQGNVIISKSDVTSDGRHAPSEIIVESLFGQEDVNGVEMKHGKWVDELTISSEDMVDHKIHLILPSTKSRIPSLSISSTKSLNFELHPSAQDVIFKQLTLKSESGDINVPSLRGSEINLETTTGTLGGTYNVSKALILKTITGNIDAKVHVLEPWAGPHRRPPPPHGNGSHPHDPEHHHDDDKEHKHKHKHHDDEHEEKKHEHDKREHKHKVRRDHKKKRHDHHHKKDKHHKKGSWLSNLFSGSKKHDHPHPPPPPPPAFIGAFSTTGFVNLTILSQGSYTSSELKAFSKTNNVTVQHAENFRGEYGVSTFVGEYKVDVPEKYKDHLILEQGKSETGGFQKGLVGFKRPKGEEPPKKKQPPNHPKEKRDEHEGEEESEEDWFSILENALLEDEVEKEFEEQNFEHDHPPPPPPDGPDGPEPPKKGPKGPGGPPPPPGGPERPHPPPPHKGPHPPHGPPHEPPHGPPHGPHGPHRPPLPPGHSRVLAHTDIGSVQVVL